MLWELSSQQTFIISKSSTFPESNALNLSLLASFFLNDIKLHNANCIFKSALQESTDLFSPVKCYNKQIIQAYKIIYNKMITIHKELKQPKKLFNACKKRSKNKKLMLQNIFVFMTKEMLQIAKKT